MKIIKINNYNDLEQLKNEKEFIVDLSQTTIEQKDRIIDFLGGLTFINGSLKKLKKDTYEVVINKKDKTFMNKENLDILIEIKEQIMNNERLKYNPIFFTGISKEKKSDMLFRTFNKDFNHNHKAQIIDLEKDNINDISITTDCLLIIDNIDGFENNKKIEEITTECIYKNIQVIKFANNFRKI